MTEPGQKSGNQSSALFWGTNPANPGNTASRLSRRPGGVTEYVAAYLGVLWRWSRHRDSKWLLASLKDAEDAGTGGQGGGGKGYLNTPSPTLLAQSVPGELLTAQ